jgi:A/G-specific adenine glycosylase
MNFQKVLINWYSKHKRNLPWRHTKDPYLVWLSEIILQQTQVKQGLPYYEKFVRAYPSVFDLANESEEQVLKLWQGLGYYSRARNMHSTAKYVACELNGRFPQQYKDLILLKGVGDYTASAIASFAFNEQKAVLDGNVYRVLARYFGISEPINSKLGPTVFKELAQELIESEKPGIYNQAIMEFGSQQCKPANPNCQVCPLNKSCAALAKGTVKSLPVKLKKTKVQTKYFNYLVVIDPQKNTCLEKREGKGIWRNLYQFPLIETQKSLHTSQFKELIEQSSFANANIKDHFLYNEEDIIHQLSHRRLYTKFWIIELRSPLKKGISLNDLKKYPVPVLIANFIEDFDYKNL